MQGLNEKFTATNPWRTVLIRWKITITILPIPHSSFGRRWWIPSGIVEKIDDAVCQIIGKPWHELILGIHEMHATGDIQAALNWL
jgi:hypothetical protein